MEKYKKIAFYGLSVAFFAILVFLFFKYIFEIILPFLIAFLIVAMARPIINSLSCRTKIPKPVVSIFVILMVAMLTILTVGIIGALTVTQIVNIVEDLVSSLSGEEGYISEFFNLIDSLEEKAPFLKSFLREGQSLSSLISEMILEGAKGISTDLTDAFGKFISSLPNIAITLIVVFLSIFYFAKDYDKISIKLVKALPKRLGNIIMIFKNDVILAISKYLKSYLILFVLCFAEVFAGFLMINQKNAFVLALIIAIVDFLPILGAGTVLAPWGIIMLVLGNYKTGIALLLLAAVTYFSRQILEPKILSSQMNIHPLITLFAMFLGLKIAGFLGLIIAPIVAFIIKITYDRIKNQKNVEMENNV